MTASRLPVRSTARRSPLLGSPASFPPPVRALMADVPLVAAPTSGYGSLRSPRIFGWSDRWNIRRENPNIPLSTLHASGYPAHARAHRKGQVAPRVGGRPPRLRCRPRRGALGRPLSLAARRRRRSPAWRTDEEPERDESSLLGVFFASSVSFRSPTWCIHDKGAISDGESVDKPAGSDPRDRHPPRERPAREHPDCGAGGVRRGSGNKPTTSVTLATRTSTRSSSGRGRTSRTARTWPCRRCPSTYRSRVEPREIIEDLSAQTVAEWDAQVDRSRTSTASPSRSDVESTATRCTGPTA